MNDQTKKALQMALEALEDICDTLGECGMTEKARTTVTAIDEALAQPQGEWVDLTDDELKAVALPLVPDEPENDSDDMALKIFHAVIAKFKEKNTPPVMPQSEPIAYLFTDIQSGDTEASCDPYWKTSPYWVSEPLYTNPQVMPQPEPLTDTYVQFVPDKCDRIVWRKRYYHLESLPNVPQGEPVAWMYQFKTEDPILCKVKRDWADNHSQWKETPLYTAPPSVEAAIEATKEKAAKVCESYIVEGIGREMAAAIRSMK
jgi:hypothetical protein